MVGTGWPAIKLRLVRDPSCRRAVAVGVDSGDAHRLAGGRQIGAVGRRHVGRAALIHLDSVRVEQHQHLLAAAHVEIRHRHVEGVGVDLDVAEAVGVVDVPGVDVVLGEAEEAAVLEREDLALAVAVGVAGRDGHVVGVDGQADHLLLARLLAVDVERVQEGLVARAQEEDRLVVAVGVDVGGGHVAAGEAVERVAGADLLDRVAHGEPGIGAQRDHLVDAVVVEVAGGHADRLEVDRQRDELVALHDDRVLALDRHRHPLGARAQQVAAGHVDDLARPHGERSALARIGERAAVGQVAVDPVAVRLERSVGRDQLAVGEEVVLRAQRRRRLVRAVGAAGHLAHAVDAVLAGGAVRLRVARDVGVTPRRIAGALGRVVGTERTVRAAGVALAAGRTGRGEGQQEHGSGERSSHGPSNVQDGGRHQATDTTTRRSMFPAVLAS